MPLSERGAERLPGVTLMDLRLSKTFRFGPRSLQPYADFFNIANADTIVGWNNAVGGTYRAPSEILAPRIVRVGFALTF